MVVKMALAFSETILKNARKTPASHYFFLTSCSDQMIILTYRTAHDGFIKKHLNASRPSEHPTQGVKCQNAMYQVTDRPK